MEVIPIPLTNLLAPVPDIRTRTYFVVHERLDVEVLRKALDDLVRHHWRKLGARVIAVAGKAGQFEYHLPQTFEDGYVLFKWTSEAKDDPIETAIPSLKCQPPTDTIGFYPAIQETEVSIGPAHWPVSRSEDDPDEPALLVHVSVYADATVVCMNILHAVADQLGLANIVKAWLGLVQGKTPPPLVGHNEDVVPHDKEFVDYKGGEMHRKGKLRVKGVLDKYLIALGFIPEFIFHPKETVLTTFLPAPLVHAIREKASKALSQEHGADPGISSGDVIAAILLKLSRMCDRSCRNLCLSQSVNLRGRVPQLQGPKADAFIHNSISYAATRFRIDSSTPISEIAYHLRKATIEALQPQEMEASMAIIRELTRRGQSIHICEPLDRSYNISSWSGAWKGIDFACAAIKDTAAATGEEAVGAEKNVPKPEMMVLGSAAWRGQFQRFNSVIMCKANNGYWCDFAMNEQSLKLVKEYLKKDPQLKEL